MTSHDDPACAGLSYPTHQGGTTSTSRRDYDFWGALWAVARDLVVKFSDALTKAGNAPEVHIFSTGGHGFGLKQQGTSSDHWIDAFYYWLKAQGLK